MEEATDLGNYLPLSFKTQSKQESIAFLWDAFAINYTHGKYQGADERKYLDDADQIREVLIHGNYLS